MECIPHTFTDHRLLREVINARFVFAAEDYSSRLHTSQICQNLKQFHIPLVTKDLCDIEADQFCPQCMYYRKDLLLDWGKSVELRGPALYAIARTPFPADDGKPREIYRQLLERIVDHFQVMTLPLSGHVQSPTWMVSTIPAKLANWLACGATYSQSPIRLTIDAPVHDRDTPAMVECAIRLWENSSNGPLSYFANAVEAARTICK